MGRQLLIFERYLRLITLYPPHNIYVHPPYNIYCRVYSLLFVCLSFLQSEQLISMKYCKVVSQCLCCVFSHFASIPQGMSKCQTQKDRGLQFWFLVNPFDRDYQLCFMIAAEGAFQKCKPIFEQCQLKGFVIFIGLRQMYTISTQFELPHI